MLPAPRGLLRASGRSCCSACGPSGARGCPVTPWGAARPAAAGWTQAGSCCPLENGPRQGQSQEAASDGATAEIPGSLFHPCVLSLSAKFWEERRQAFPSRNPTDSVSLPSTWLWGAELKVGSAPGLAFIPHKVGQGQPRQFPCVFPTKGAGSYVLPRIHSIRYPPAAETAG